MSNKCATDTSKTCWRPGRWIFQVNFSTPIIEYASVGSEKKHISLKLDQRTKGESDTAVAAASILVRERFIDYWVDATTKKVGFTIPLGTSQQVVTAGRTLVGKHGQEVLGKFAKLHFNLDSAVETKNFTAKPQRKVYVSGYSKGFFTTIPFHPLGEPTSFIFSSNSKPSHK